MVKNKKGMSAIVTTLILILLVIVSVGIVWGVLKNTILKSTEQISLDDLNVDLVIKKVLINDTGVKVVVHRNAGGGEITGLKFIVSDKDESQSFERPGVIETLDTKSYFLEYTRITKTVEVAPIFTTESGKNKTGKIADKYEVEQQEVEEDVFSCECDSSKQDYKVYDIKGKKVYVDCEHNKCWTPTVQNKYTWINAINYCDNLMYGGYNDWVLPTKTNLSALCNSPSCSGTCFGSDGFIDHYWSHTEEDNTKAWSVLFATSYCGNHNLYKSAEVYVRCSRG